MTRHRVLHGVRAILALSMIAVLAIQALPAQRASADAALVHLFASGSATGGKRIHFRVKLTEPAPQGGVNIPVTTSDPAIPPITIHVNTGETEKTKGVTTNPVTSTRTVTATATYKGVSKSNTVIIKEPFHSSLSTQTVCRPGGLCRVIPRLSGRAPAGGIDITMTAEPEGVLQLPAVAHIEPGQASLYMRVPVTEQSNDVTVAVTSTYKSPSQPEFTYINTILVRHYTTPPDPTATSTNTPEPTATSTDTPEPTATETNTPEPTATETNTPEPTATETSTPEPTATSTATTVPQAPSVTVTYIGPVNPIRGSTVNYQVCASDSPASDMVITWAPNNANYLYANNSGTHTIAAGATGDNLCFDAPLTGRNPDGNARAGTVHLVFTVNGTDVIAGDDVTFVAPAPTATNTPEPTATNTVVPVAQALAYGCAEFGGEAEVPITDGRLVSDITNESSSDDVSGCGFDATGVTLGSQLEFIGHNGLTYESGDCAGGAPRYIIGTDAGTVFVYFGATGIGDTNCVGSGVNLLETNNCTMGVAGAATNCRALLAEQTGVWFISLINDDGSVGGPEIFTIAPLVTAT
jgi:hypothetical protein